MPETNETICYCFGYSSQDIREDARRHGRSTIMERIMAESKAGGCNCAARNPKGR
jgi:bacterioferritin-associated ferredoxin